MGKRKERRLAALSASNRRVKLDLFAEPTGDLVGTSLHDEVGRDLDQNHRAVASVSPSSSGQEQENPLTLLGQYSDDELDEEGSKTLEQVVVGSTLNDHNGQVEEQIDVEGDGVKCDTGNDLAAQVVKQESTSKDLDPLDAVENLDDSNIEEGEVIVTDTVNPCNETDSMAKEGVPVSSGMQIIGDVTNGWKLVMHEESSQYYYWNTLTGETSWEVPDVLVQETEITTGEKVSPVKEEKESEPADIHLSGSSSNGELEVCPNVVTIDEPKNTDVTAEIEENHGGFEMDMQDEGCKGENQEFLKLHPDANQSASNNCASAMSVSFSEASAVYTFDYAQQSRITLSVPKGSTTTGGECLTAANHEDMDKDPIIPNQCHESNITTTRLVEHCQSLLQKLKGLEGASDGTHVCDRILKYMTEVETRLSDCKALSLYGSSLLPFWIHTETQLKRLEFTIEGEASRFDKFGHLNGMETGKISSYQSDITSWPSKGADSEVDGNKKGVVFSNVEDAYDIFKEMVQKEVHQIPTNEDVINIKNKSHVGEDMDMDVDMEVDEDTPANNTDSADASATQYLTPPEQLVQPNPPLKCPSPIVNESDVPPPPDDDWIPPPPDNDLVPPPPPDEPPPTYPEAIPPLPYTDQYNLVYQVPSFEYYAPTVTEIANSNYYTPTEGAQIVVNAFTEATSAIVNPIESVVYYDLSSGTVPPEPIISSVEPSFYGESGTIGYHNKGAPDHMGSVGIAAESSISSLPSMQVEYATNTVCSENEMVAVQTTSVSATAQAAGTVVANENVEAAPLVAATKNQSKGVSSKRRTVAVSTTLRSNKKVSSLVDKWKAAKEELHGDEEDEPEHTYEILEKKRQKQIEQWRAQQITSGEARDNANFQPLGGDWRERVKRKKNKSSSEAVQTPPEVVVSEKQQPNLMELSKDLPSGWQAYWDEATKEVYYGNLVTSETTWIRPTS